MKRYIPGALLLALALPVLWIDRTLFWATYLAAWWFCTGIVLGALANLSLHTLTAGEWGEAIRQPLSRVVRMMPLLALLFLPVLAGMADLYPWAAMKEAGPERWAGELARPGFKSVWLTPWFFIARSIGYLAIWIMLASLTRRPRFARSKRYAALTLIVYCTTVSLAALDWVMSLVPVWYSTGFGLLVIVGQMLAALAYAIVVVAWRGTATPATLRDLGNLLLTYVLGWAYLAYTQFLIIWAANLPLEIAWYVPRLNTAWRGVAMVLIIGHFFVPLLVLLSRGAKEAPFLIGSLAAALLALHMLDAWWLVLPSVRPESVHALWLAPLLALALIAFAGARARVADVSPGIANG